MPVASRLALLIALASASTAHAAVVPAAHRAAARPAVAVRAVSFETAGAALTVRVRTSAVVASFSAQRDGRTVRLTIVGADLASDVERGRVAPPVRDYRIDDERDGVTLTFDVPGGSVPSASRDSRSTDLLLTFVSAETASRRETRPTSRRAGGWGRSGADTPRDEPARSEPVRDEPVRDEPARSEPVRAETRPVDTPIVSTPRTPTRRTRRPAETPTPVAPDPTPAGEAPPAPAWQTPPPVVVPYTPEASAVYVANGRNWRLDTIVLDAGHGGHDIGATYNGVREKDVTLGITLALGRMIEQELGLRVVYTRRDDHFEELRERGRIANRSGGKLFVSIHANAAPTAPTASGTETYFLAPHRTASAQEVMDRENAVIQLESAPALYAEFTQQGDILQAMAMSAYQEESQSLARLVETRMTGQGRRSRGVKQAGFLVLWAASMPAILVETGFVSNVGEARLLGSREGQEQTARGIFEAIAAYRDQYERGLQTAAGG